MTQHTSGNYSVDIAARRVRYTQQSPVDHADDIVPDTVIVVSLFCFIPESIEEYASPSLECHVVLARILLGFIGVPVELHDPPPTRLAPVTNPMTVQVLRQDGRVHGVNGHV